MKWVRILVRGTAASIVTGGLWSAWLLVHLLLFPVPQVQRRWRRLIFRAWGRTLCRVLGVHIEVVGKPSDEPGVLVCNHLTYIDIPVLAGYLDTVFVAKSEIASWPAIGFLSRHMGTIFIDRGRNRSIPEVNRQIDAALAAGDGVVIFPEGTSTSGAAVAPFRASLLEPAAEAQRPVHVASLSYRTAEGMRPPSEVVCWWGDMEFGPHLIQFLGLKRVDGRLEFGTTAVVESDRKLLAEKLWRAVDQLFIPMA